MKYSYKWLKEYVGISSTVKEVSQRLTMAGLEIESVEKINSDHILDIEITPNRPDCLSMIGLARELSAIYQTPLIYPKVPTLNKISKPYSVENKCDQSCLSYHGLYIQGVMIRPSKKNISNKLNSLGVRPINNVVDITNFCLLELGQPMHAFDADKIVGNKIIVRNAKKGESIVTLDGVKRKLDTQMLVIADEEKPIAIAGIMGGKATEVTSATQNVLLESAYFDPLLIRKTSRKLGLSTDSSYRFERGVVFENVEIGLRRGCQLLIESAGGKVVQRGAYHFENVKQAPIKIEFNLSQFYQRLGIEVNKQHMKKIFNGLEIKVKIKSDNIWQLSPPTFRTDLTRQEDITEELARIIGYDNLPTSQPTIRQSNVLQDSSRAVRQTVRRLMVGQGFSEILTFTTVSEEQIQSSREENSGIRIVNPLSLEQEYLRPSVLVSHLNVVQNNVNKGQLDLKLFEIGKVFCNKKEKEVLAFILTGKEDAPDWRSIINRPVDFYSAKGCLEALLMTFGIRGAAFEHHTDPSFENGHQARILFQSKEVGLIGKIDQDVCQAWQIKYQDVYFAQIDMNVLSAQAQRQTKHFKLISEFPASSRDISLAIDKNIPFGSVKHIIKQSGGALLNSIELVEEYTGEKIDRDKKGLVISLTYQANDRTLKDNEINDAHLKISEALVQELAVVIR